MHANTAITQGRKLASVVATNPRVQWNKALCYYVKVSACNCRGCFDGFIIYNVLFKKAVLQRGVGLEYAEVWDFLCAASSHRVVRLQVEKTRVVPG